jgi:CubicO group peptidase (beta-lactamase class C family)
MTRLSFVALVACVGRSFGAVEDSLSAALQRVANKMQSKYNMSIAAAFYSPKTSTAVAAGYTDAGLGIGTPTRRALPDDLYVWGSTTKMFTASAILQLVENGTVALTDPITKHIDPILQHLNGTTLSQYFDNRIQDVELQHLLHMTSGIADYDGEAYAHAQFANRSKDFGPVEIIQYVSRRLKHAPGTSQSYCSTNYILLGLVLANHYHKTGSTWSWQGYDQMSVIPDALRKAFHASRFITSGTCQDHTPVHGFMQSYSTASLPPQDVWNVSCVGGWTAGNYVGSVADVARFSYELWSNKNSNIVSATSLARMTNFTAPSSWPGHKFKFYGMGTFSLDWSIGDGEAFGHVGDTYGYQSQTTYFPELDFVISVATNVETSSQAQPADFTCLAYHEVKALLDGTTAPTCTFTVPHRFIGTCKCSSEILV